MYINRNNDEDVRNGISARARPCVGVGVGVSMYV